MDNHQREGLKHAGEAEEMPSILLVEDDPDYMWLISSGLKAEYHVMEAVNGREGLEKALESLPDLIVSDLMMPVMDGIELCRRLKTTIETSHIPVVLLTAKSAVESQIEGVQTGADEYITKPFNMALLKAKLRNLLDMRRKLRECFSRDFKMPNAPLGGPSPDQEFLQMAFAVLDEHCSTPEFSADLFADALDMSLRTLYRKLKALTNETPSKLIWNARVKKAALLLESSDLRVTEICYETGFKEPGHFSRLFKNTYGMTPSEYRLK